MDEPSEELSIGGEEEEEMEEEVPVGSFEHSPTSLDSALSGMRGRSWRSLARGGNRVRRRLGCRERRSSSS